MKSKYKKRSERVHAKREKNYASTPSAVIDTRLQRPSSHGVRHLETALAILRAPPKPSYARADLRPAYAAGLLAMGWTRRTPVSPHDDYWLFTKGERIAHVWEGDRLQVSFTGTNCKLEDIPRKARRNIILAGQAVSQ